MAAPAAEGSTLPASLLATDTHNALKRHVFPPFYPSPSQFEQARDPSSTDMSMNDSGAPSPTTHALFELYGAFNFVPDLDPPGEIVSVLRSAQQPASSPPDFINEWNTTLKTQSKRVWKFKSQVRTSDTSLVLVPNYTQRSNGYFGGTGGVAPIVQKWRPQDEDELNNTFIGFSAPLLEAVFSGDNVVLKEESKLEGLTYLWAAPPKVGSGTTDISMRKPPDMTDSDWEMMQNFIAEFKLMPDADLHALVRAVNESQFSPDSASPLQPGFQLSRDAEGKFNTSAASLPPVFERVLPQIVEQFSTHHAHLLLLGNYDVFVLVKLKAANTASISGVIYRDPNLHPALTLHPPGSLHNPVLMEIIIAAMLSTTPAKDRNLWRDMAVVREHARRKDERQSKRKLSEDGSSKASKSTRGSTSAYAGAADSNLATETATVTVRASKGWKRGQDAGHRSLFQDNEQWVMELPSSVETLYHELCALHGEHLESATTEPGCAMPPLSTSPANSSISVPNPDRPHSQGATLIFGKYLGSGRLYDVYSGRLEVGGKEVDAAFKYVDFKTFIPEYDAGAAQWGAIHDEVDLLLHAAEACPDIAPRFFGLWSHGRYEDGYILAVEDCGSSGGCGGSGSGGGEGSQFDLTDAAKAAEVREAYRKLHAAGMVHNDVEQRHILRDRCGRVRIIDWEAGFLGSPEDCEEEMEKVELMIRAELERKERCAMLAGRQREC